MFVPFLLEPFPVVISSFSVFFGGGLHGGCAGVNQKSSEIDVMNWPCWMILTRFVSSLKHDDRSGCLRCETVGVCLVFFCCCVGFWLIVGESFFVVVVFQGWGCRFPSLPRTHFDVVTELEWDFLVCFVFIASFLESRVAIFDVRGLRFLLGFRFFFVQVCILK